MLRKLSVVFVALMSFSLIACSDFGDVEQGRAVAFDKDKMEVTFIKDSGTDDAHPEYRVLPPMTMKMPADPKEIGPWPVVGLRMKLDLDAKTIIMFNPGKESFETIAVEVVSKDENVDARKQHPLVFDSTTGEMRKFPVINNEEKTVTIYSARQKIVSTLRLSAEDFDKYHENDWLAGDEVRVYFKDPTQMLRFMNVTKTDPSKRK